MKKLAIASFVLISTIFFWGSVKAEEVVKQPMSSEVNTTIQYNTHVQNIGWQEIVDDGKVAGTEGKSLRLEAVKLNIKSNLSGSIVYQTHVQNIGWQESVSDGKIAGTEGKSLRLEAIKIQLTGELANYYDIYYQTHVQNIGWIDWSKNGEPSGSTGYSYRLEAIRIVLVKKGASAPGKIDNHFYKAPISVAYQTHVQNIGWQDSTSDGQLAGTEGKSLRLEGITISLNNNDIGGSITYQTHVQNIGWQDSVSNGLLSGTEGKSLRLEAIKLNLTGEIANYYDIYYQVHVQNVGWMNWAKNGAASGSQGLGYRMEAIRIKLVKKGEPAPTGTGHSFLYDSTFVWSGQTGNRTLKNNYSGMIGTNVKKIIDVSSHQGIIDWNTVKNSGEIDGVILRIGYATGSEDKMLAYNIRELKRLQIPYGIYLFSYAENETEALGEANFTISLIQRYALKPTLGLYYDIESWNIGNYIPNITPETYEKIITTYTSTTLANGYASGVYTNLKYARERLTENSRNHVNWIAQYNTSCTYTGSYKMWQYSSTEYVSGINTKVDMNVMFQS